MLLHVWGGGDMSDVMVRGRHNSSKRGKGYNYAHWKYIYACGHAQVSTQSKAGMGGGYMCTKLVS